jgi:hypothetical protein
MCDALLTDIALITILRDFGRKTLKSPGGIIRPGPSISQRRAAFDLAMWREREGVEPPEDIEGCPPSGLKSVEPTRAHTLPW